MSADASSFAPRQDRSRRTERALIEATIALMREGGLAACTVPAVAERAGVSVGAVYRRYPDKQAMVAAALMSLASLDDGAQDAAYARIAESASDLHAFFRAVAATAIAAGRDHRMLVLASRAFVRACEDQAWLALFRSRQGRGREVLLGAARTRFGEAVPEAALRTALAAIYGAVEVTWLEPLPGLFVDTPDPDAFADALADMQAAYVEAVSGARR